MVIKLSSRERQVLDYIAEGKTDGEIACILHLSMETIKTHGVSIRNKLGAVNRAHAVALYFKR